MGSLRVLILFLFLLAATSVEARAGLTGPSKGDKINGNKKGRCMTKPSYDIGQGAWPDACTNRQAGQTCVAECMPGLNATGSPTVTCQADNTWSQPIAPATCEPTPVLPPDDGGGAALPVDVVITASACQAGMAPGITTSATFTVTATLNPEYLLNVTIQVTFPSVLWPSVVLTCQNAAAQSITCEPAAFTANELAQDILALGCLLGDMTALGDAAQCTLAYTTPPTPEALAALMAAGTLNTITGSLTYAPFQFETIVEDKSDNAAATCAVA